MSAMSQSSQDDPLIAALPPATDYITYLTLLEYQLTTQNLPTLNRLLSEDDGTLVAEIGWDLLRLILPMLQVVPQEAGQCLETIARRGNPREVVVRVSEELERLGKDGSDANDEDEDESMFVQEDLPTFAGEATRVHLGDMTLDGMQHQPDSGKDKTPAGTNGKDDEVVESGSDNGLLFQALLSMLSILHPRIKTQYPSRFLATSLPAALGAYRHLPITAETTTAFITALTKLSGSQRPTLPPRTSTAGSLPISKTLQTSPENQLAPLPDPEAAKELAESAATTTDDTASNEKAITRKLLQAVTLEVLDDYVQSFHATDTPHMQWTSRKREIDNPSRVVPNRLTAEQLWQQNDKLKLRDIILTKFIKLGKDIGLDVSQALQSVLTSSHDTAPDQGKDLAPDYPASPDDVPFPLSGLITLCAAQHFYQAVPSNPASNQTLSLEKSVQTLHLLFTSHHSHNVAEIDAILLLLCRALSPDRPQQGLKTVNPQSVSSLLSTLTEIFTTNPDQSIRDNAHYIATGFLHAYADEATKLGHIVSILCSETENQSPIYSVQTGNLRAIAINWLKDEMLSGGVKVAVLNTDATLRSQIFPTLPTPPGPFISSHPPAGSTPGAALATENDLEKLLLLIPAYISALNLVSVLTKLTRPGDVPGQAPPSTSKDANPVFSGLSLIEAEKFLDQTEIWKDTLLALVLGARPGETGGPVDVSDIYALEDACKRARAGILHITG